MFGFSSKDNAREWTDEEIISAASAQPWVFAILVERYQTPFLRKTRGIIRNPLDAEEVVQDAFTKIYINAHRFTPQDGAKFSSWAYRILLNTAFTKYQRLIKEGQRFTNLDPEFEQFVGERAEHAGFAEASDAIERILARLPGHFASVLRLHYLERWSQEDIALRTGENVGTIKARIHRAKAAFRAKTAPGEIDILLE